MREMKYGLLCEDDAHREFLRMALSFLAADSTNFEEVKTHIQAKNKREVDRNFAKACSVAFVTYKVDVFFVVRDVDSANDVNFSELYILKHPLKFGSLGVFARLGAINIDINDFTKVLILVF